ncbi:MAG TPA: hypothetical protein VMQ17_08645, partial [Candidatus Sulfotelmatobacter sp.]|nr:hypothetical protein [Candidatus Sulfotelmatobacter sp.]
MDGLERSFTRPRQVRYQAALRPDIFCFFDFKPLPIFPILSGRPNRAEIAPTVIKPHQLAFTVSKPARLSFALRLIFRSASLFICECFLKTVASPHRNNWATRRRKRTISSID